jgi:DNA-directed RNA polymerase subunit beta'
MEKIIGINTNKIYKNDNLPNSDIENLHFVSKLKSINYEFTHDYTKKVLENLVHETFTQFGNLSSSSLLDSLKLLGFYYATNAGISINIEDLKTPDAKKQYLKNANSEIQHVSKQWEQGFISDSERFQSIIDIWNLVTESLKNRIIDYYQNFDPANNLYIMAFSGARGNMSQVRQLVGMRGLMSDQEGKIIDLPIQTNFREGLSSIDYIISSYGARKGIVDTALKTADSGYLTRRLIYIAQDLVIRELNCQSKDGVIILLNKNSDIKSLICRTIISTKVKNARTDFSYSNYSLDKKLLTKFQKEVPLTLNIRASLTCKSLGSICQNCYGWDLAKEKPISLGEAVGIIAAQSIGEPGTQLTMRTFHTGGIFTGENTKQILAPFSGKLIFPTGLKKRNYRTNHGINVLKLQEEGYVTLINWEGIETEIFLTIGSYLYISTSSILKKG